MSTRRNPNAEQRQALAGMLIAAAGHSIPNESAGRAMGQAVRAAFAELEDAPDGASPKSAIPASKSAPRSGRKAS